MTSTPLDQASKSFSDAGNRTPLLFASVLAPSALVFLAWVVTAHWHFQCAFGDIELEAGHGILLIYSEPGANRDPDVRLRRCEHWHLSWAMPSTYRKNWSASITYIIPFWLIQATLLIPIFILTRSRFKSRRPGHCQTCGYDLTGNTSGVCPECGHRMVKAPAAAVDSHDGPRPT